MEPIGVKYKSGLQVSAKLEKNIRSLDGIAKYVIQVLLVLDIHFALIMQIIQLLLIIVVMVVYI